MVVKPIAPLVSEVTEVSDFLFSSYACTRASFAIVERFFGLVNDNGGSLTSLTSVIRQGPRQPPSPFANKPGWVKTTFQSCQSRAIGAAFIATVLLSI